MQIEHLREFLAVANEGSFTAAAQKMFVAQPVLSKHVHGIEERLSAQLLIRSPKGLSLTPLGEEAYAAFEQITECYDALLSQVRQMEGKTAGQLRMGILTTGIDKYVVPLTSTFSRRFPNAHFSYVTEKPQFIVRDLMEGKLDIGFVAQGNFNDKGLLSYQLIGQDELRLVLPTAHPATERNAVAPEDLIDDTLVCLDAKETTDTLNGLLFAAGFRPKRIRRVEEIEVAMAEIATSGGYFVIPDFMSAPFSGFRGITVTDLATPVHLPIYLGYKTANTNPLIPPFLACAEEGRREAESRT